jgi:hypothetical protein
VAGPLWLGRTAFFRHLQQVAAQLQPGIHQRPHVEQESL